MSTQRMMETEERLCSSGRRSTSRVPVTGNGARARLVSYEGTASESARNGGKHSLQRWYRHKCCSIHDRENQNEELPLSLSRENDNRYKHLLLLFLLLLLLLLGPRLCYTRQVCNTPVLCSLPTCNGQVTMRSKKNMRFDALKKNW